MSPTSVDALQDDSFCMRSPDELEWVQLQPFLLKRGYRLPPRYHPDWKPSWKKRRLWGSKRPWNYADSRSFYNTLLVDVVRISDRKKVVLKRVNPRQDIPILEYLHSPELSKDSRNNTVPILDIIYHPDKDDVAFIVMPILYSFENASVPFEYVSEVLDALDQFLKGLEFLHEQHIAHRDACMLNLMMDATKVLPGGFHFAKPTRRPDGRGHLKPCSRRSVSPVKYYMIDYELALYYPGNEHDSFGRLGQDKTVPEFADEHALYDPFKLDVYQMGGVISYLAERYGLSFLENLEAQMRCRDPAKRPTAAEAYRKFSDIAKSLPLEETTRKITRIPEEIGVSHLRGPEKYEEATDAKAHTDPDTSQESDCVGSADPGRQHDLPDLPDFTSADALDSSPAQAAEAMVTLPIPDSSKIDSTSPAMDLRAIYGDCNKPDHDDHDQSALDIPLSLNTSHSVISLHSETLSRSIPTTHSIDTAPTSVGSTQSHEVESVRSARGTHSIRTAQSIDTMPTSVGSVQSQHIAEASQVVDTTKPEALSSPSEPPTVPPHVNSSAPAAGPAKSIPTTQSNPRWWTFLFKNIKGSFRS